MSTSAEIGRSPIAVSRCCSQAGEGPLHTPRISRPVKCGQARSRTSGASVTVIGLLNLPGTGALADADLLVVFTRFRDLPPEQTAPITAFLNAGKPVIGLRTATHAFAGKMEDGGWTYGDWQQGGFGLKILGETWVAHHGIHKKEGARGVVEEANASHPVLRGVKDVFAPSDVYTVKNLKGDETILMRGVVTETLDPASKAVEGEKNDPLQALARRHGGKPGIFGHLPRTGGRSGQSGFLPGAAR